jgi:putative nucleotidyltransferase with HDIG domain
VDKKESVREAVLKIRELPTLPTVLGKILSAASDPDSSVLELGELISSDQSLAATLLRLVNSAYYGFYRQIESVTQAIVMLGFLEVRKLTLTATAFRNFGKGAVHYDRVQLWRHSLASALAAENIAQTLNAPVTGCFEAGLLHDIGKVIFDILYPDEFRKAAEMAHDQECPIYIAEEKIIGMNHAEAGGILADHWNLPESVAEAIRCHLNPREAEWDPRLTWITALASHITCEAGLGEASNGCALPYPEEIAAELGFTQENREAVIADLRENQESIDVFIGVLNNP